MKSISAKYILDENDVPVEEPDTETWGIWMGKNSRRIAETMLDNGKLVSTVFLGLDHSFSQNGPPILFETMVFTNSKSFADEHMERYSTKAAALIGHQVAVDKFN